MTTTRIALLNTIPDAAWFLVQKARELQEHDGVLPADMLFITQGSGGIRSLAVRLAKHMLPFRSLENSNSESAIVGLLNDLGLTALKSHFRFVLVSSPLRDQLTHLCSLLKNDDAREVYISLCLDGYGECDELAFRLDAQLSPIVESLEPGTVYFRKVADEWSCEWPDRPLWMVPKILVEIATFLAGYQRRFLESGISHLKPLSLADVADHIGCHLSSVSRIISGRQAQTEWGRFPLKCFFSGALPSNGGAVSQATVKARIAEIVANEDRCAPFSDDAIMQALNRSGITVSRRAVTKYRLSLQIGSTRVRE